MCVTAHFWHFSTALFRKGPPSGRGDLHLLKTKFSTFFGRRLCVVACHVMVACHVILTHLDVTPPSLPCPEMFQSGWGGGVGRCPLHMASILSRQSFARSEVLRFPPERIASAAILSCQHIPPPNAALFVLLASLPWIMAHMQPCSMRINARNDIEFHVRVTPRVFFWRCSCFACYPSLQSSYFPSQTSL